jgi:hypothetical protein
MDTSTNPLQLGLDFSHVIPVAADPTKTEYVDAGPLRIGVEYRVLDSETTFSVQDGQGGTATQAMAFADKGFCLHVYDKVTGLEHLRFDAFDDEPHYHYMMPGTSNMVVVFDAAAHGDMLDWSLDCLRGRLPAMLKRAGANELAEGLGDELPPGVVAEVTRLVRPTHRPVDITAPAD